MGTIRATAAAGTVVLALAACGEEKKLEGEDAAKPIAAQSREKGVALREVSCKDMKAEVGAALSCTALNPAGTKLVIEGSVTKVDGDRARYRYKAVGGTADGARLARQGRTLLERRVGQRAKSLTCPEKVRMPTRPSVTCTLETRDGLTFDVKLIVDADGELELEVADKPR